LILFAKINKLSIKEAKEIINEAFNICSNLCDIKNGINRFLPQPSA
jgi:hypothetical protein